MRKLIDKCFPRKPLTAESVRQERRWAPVAIALCVVALLIHLGMLARILSLTGPLYYKVRQSPPPGVDVVMSDLGAVALIWSLTVKPALLLWMMIELVRYWRWARRYGVACVRCGYPAETDPAAICPECGLADRAHQRYRVTTTRGITIMRWVIGGWVVGGVLAGASIDWFDLLPKS